MGLEIILTAPEDRSPTVNTTSRAPAPYRFPSTALLYTDTILLFRNFLFLPWIVFPLNTSNKRGELYLWSAGNLFTLFLHVVFIIVGIAGLGLIPLWLRLPGGLWLVIAGLYWAVVYALAWALNQTPEGELISSEPAMKEKEGEKWLFVNGVRPADGGCKALSMSFPGVSDDPLMRYTTAHSAWCSTSCNA